MQRAEIPIGSFAFWLVWKFITIFVLVVVPLFAFGGPEFKDPLLYVVVFIVMGIMIISNEELVYGRATEDGIYFRRYFKMQFLSWDAISSIKWSSSDRIQFQMKSGILFRRELSAQSFGSESWPVNFFTPPEVVRWLLVTRPSGAEGIELRPPQPSTWFQNLNPVGGMRFTFFAVLSLGTLMLYLLLRVH